jgi:hypothetical protein
MSCVGVTAQAIGRARGIPVVHERGQIAMTPEAGFLHYLSVEPGYLYRLVKVTHGKGPAVIPSVQTLDGPVREKIIRSMAVDAVRNRLVTPVIPGIVHVAHHMAIGARRRIIGEIRTSLGEIEDESAKSGNASSDKRDQDGYPE